MKKNILRMLCLLLAAVLLPLTGMAEGTGAAPVTPFRDLTAAEITAEMGTGWNLGNTMDGHTGFTPGETVWQPTMTTRTTIDAVHDAGFSTIRVPVTWGTMIDDENGYKIDEKWMSRVQDIVDYAIRQDMYVILNIHHDGAEQTGWLRIAYEGEQLETVKAKFAAVWQQIAETFRDYDEHLIFEAMNEVCGDDPSQAGYIKDFRTIEALNQIFVDTVRATGGNNAKRWLSVPPRYTNIINVLNTTYGFTMPNDPANRLMLSVHDYDYSFGIQDNMNATYWSQEKALNLSKYMEQLKTNYVDKGIPVVLGEYGAVNKNNLANRVYYYEAMNRMCALCGVIPVLWDQGWYDNTRTPADYTFSLFDRGTGEQLYPEIIKGIMRGYYNTLSGNLRRNITKIDYINKSTVPTYPGFDSLVSADKMILLDAGTMGQVNITTTGGEDCQDTLLYSSTNPDVVTVNKNGQLNAKATGGASIIVTSANGSAKITVPVSVKPATNVAARETAIITDKDAYELDMKTPVQMVVTLDKAEEVFYTTSDASIVTVNTFGKLVGIAPGTATVTIQTASGMKKQVQVTVTGTVPGAAPDEPASLNIAIGVYYSDAAHNYYANETGPSITVSGDGTYTLTYDAIDNSTNAAKAAGVFNLNGAGAIYIYDIDGNAGLLQGVNIHYDEILLDGVAMAINEHAPKSALKASGKFDTNDPLNAWDGSVSPDVTYTGDKNIVFTNNDKPRSIQITFTLSDWQQ